MLLDTKSLVAGSAMASSVYLKHSEHSPMKAVLSLASRIATIGANALVLGETGVGKRDLALHLHGCSPRSANHVAELMCTGASEEALQRALFGDEHTLMYRGGLFGAARGGALLLHEIADLPPQLQKKLMNALFMSGSADPFNPGRAVRLIATSSRGLQALTEEHLLERGLLDLLSCRVEIQPLRARRADIAPMMQAVWSCISGAGELTTEAMDVLIRQDWPGNVRQLEAFALRLAVSTAGERVGAVDVHQALRVATSNGVETCSDASGPDALPLPSLDRDSIVQQVLATGMTSFLESVEESLISWALTATGGRRYAAAKLLGLKRTTLVEKLRRRDPDSRRFACREQPPRGGTSELGREPAQSAA
jgi:sigma-54 dependent transcriptional regulator, flagellar regulatory protein